MFSKANELLLNVLLQTNASLLAAGTESVCFTVRHVRWRSMHVLWGADPARKTLKEKE